jgi:tetratricopeptide (TPR) repeat protein
VPDLPDADRPNAEPAEDMQAYLNKTRQLARQGRYREALDRFVWFHEHALERDPAMSGVRLSFALSYWKDLADVYPPAKQAFIEMRDRKTRQLQQGRGNAQTFHDVAEMNRVLGENAATVRLFREIGKANPALASRCWFFARQAVFAEKQYDVAKKYLPAPLKAYDLAKAQYDEDVARHNISPLSGHYRQWLDKHFVDECLELIELANAIGDKKAAEEIRQRAAGVVDDPRLRATDVPPSKAGSSQSGRSGTPGPDAAPSPHAVRHRGA